MLIYDILPKNPSQNAETAEFFGLMLIESGAATEQSDNPKTSIVRLDA